MKMWLELGAIILKVLIRSKVPEGTRESCSDVSFEDLNDFLEKRVYWEE